MKLYIPSNGPFIFVMEENNLPIDDIVNTFKDSFVDLDKGRQNSPAFYMWNDTKLYIFIFNTLNEKKFLDFYSKFFFEKIMDNNIAYKNFGINMFEFLARERGNGLYVILVENVDKEFYNKTSSDYHYIDIGFNRYNLSSKELFEIQSAFKRLCKSTVLSEGKTYSPINHERLLELYVKFPDGEAYKIGFVYFAPSEFYEKKFAILFLPKVIITQHSNFFKKLVFSFNHIGLYKHIYRFVYTYLSEPFLKFFDAVDQITIGADFEFELYDKTNGSSTSASSILAYSIYKDRSYVDLKRTKIGVDGNSSIGELRTTPVKICELDKFFKDVDKLIEKTKRGINEVFNNIDINFIGKKYPLGFHVHFGIPKQVIGMDFDSLSSEETNYFGKSIESLLNLILYRYLYTLNSFRRWESGYSSYNGYEKIKKKKYGIEYRLFPSSIILERFYKTVITFAVDLIKRYFTKGNLIKIPLNEHYEIDESFYPAEFFEKLWKIKELVKLNDDSTSYYEQITKKFTRFERESVEFLEGWKEVDEMINLLNNVYLRNGFVYYDCYILDVDTDKPFYRAREYYDMINRKPIMLYGLALPKILIWKSVTKKYDNELATVVYEMLKEMEVQGSLKTSHEKLWEELTNRFKFLKPKNEKMVVS